MCGPKSASEEQNYSLHGHSWALKTPHSAYSFVNNFSCSCSRMKNFYLSGKQSNIHQHQQKPLHYAFGSNFYSEFFSGEGRKEYNSFSSQRLKNLQVLIFIQYISTFLPFSQSTSLMKNVKGSGLSSFGFLWFTAETQNSHPLSYTCSNFTSVLFP